MKPIQGFFFRDFKNTYMPEILKEIYRDRVYEPYFEDKKDLTIIDFGANIGLWTYYAAPFASKLYAVEPSQEHFECLLTMVMTNNLEQTVTPIRKAISNENGEAKFYHNDNTTMFSLSENLKNDDFEVVETLTLDKFFEENNIEHVDLIKIDIEGAEAELFGGEGFDKVKDKIDVIVGEFHTWTGVKPDLFASYFRDRGFTFKWLNKTEATLFVAERIK